eukprot:CAMPEP_0206404574 /NCGR_PEP_ID=MMETSP0294-20121207/28487_1 /ASSEMBLY_ACC=CAM_ASM_000327 /TAXON_ID=39354 /ORGANISM="Heterosigma akashiwo, Strain CCMP2393" /LENGTH=42 /DNA_ID= /DNA_START= /DNA_END= /DNA_ORIENTATION=
MRDLVFGLGYLLLNQLTCLQELKEKPEPNLVLGAPGGVYWLP